MTMKDDIVLGRNVTALAKGKKAKDTNVISVRLPIGEISHLETIARLTNKNLSQVVREAVLNHYATFMGSQQPYMTIQCGQIFAASYGTRPQSSLGRVIVDNERIELATASQTVSI